VLAQCQHGFFILALYNYYFVPVKNFFLLILAQCLLFIASSQTRWQQQTDYTIDVSLNEKEKTLDGFEEIIYTNNSPDTLRYIWFHLWPNAYKNDRTAFSDQLLENGNTAFYFSTQEQKGYMNRLDFKADGITAKTEDHPQHTDIIKVVLPKPLAPKEKTVVRTSFHVKLPYNFSRIGYDGESFQVTQWYPKPAVYDQKGWHPMPYLDQGEFYSEFGSYDVRITVPKNYVVAATGELQNEEEKAWLKSRTNYTMPVTPIAKKVVNTRTRQTKTSKPAKPIQETAQGFKTLHFKQDKAHDFAWFANKHFIVKSDSLALASGRVIAVSSYYTPTEKKVWEGSVRYAKDALRFYSAEVGEYPYNTATVVQGPASFGGGMEYPTITVLSPTANAQVLDETIAHELGHNWFYGILATNEREHPWMDEGMNTFYERKYMAKKYGAQGKEEAILLQTKITNQTDQPIATRAVDLSTTNYYLSVYHKAAEWMAMLEKKMGEDAFRAMMQQYYQVWKFRHPQPEDFQQIVASKAGTGTEEIFGYLTAKGALPNSVSEGSTFVFPFKKGAIENYTRRATRNAMIALPAVGFNSYDKLMIGALLTNYGSPAVKLNFLAIPLYGTGSKSLSGLGKLNYSIRSSGAIRRTDLFVNAASFTMADFRDEEDTKHQLRFEKLVPGLRFTFREKSPRSTVNKFVQWKTYLFREEGLNATIDSVITPSDTTIRFHFSKQWDKRYLHQLQFVYQDNRELYPFDVALQVEQAKDFVRSTLRANYFFNYAKGGGMGVRLFAGKFHYLNGKTVRKQFDNDRYHLNMTGAKGYEDYTYSDYFVGRNEFEGLASQQIMIRDGGFKVRTDQLANKVGKTDNWLMAANLVTTIPDKLNPLSILPIKIPLRAFMDLGTSAEAWDRNANTDRLLFDAGIQLSLFDEVVNIYVPLFYSKVYRNYFKSTIPDNRLLKTISFSINFLNKDLKKLARETEIL
jgi:hypothetical protein